MIEEMDDRDMRVRLNELTDLYEGQQQVIHMLLTALAGSTVFDRASFLGAMTFLIERVETGDADNPEAMPLRRARQAVIERQWPHRVLSGRAGQSEHPQRAHRTTKTVDRAPLRTVPQTPELPDSGPPNDDEDALT